jgi:hypothetical protein
MAPWFTKFKTKNQAASLNFLTLTHFIGPIDNIYFLIYTSIMGRAYEKG